MSYVGQEQLIGAGRPEVEAKGITRRQALKRGLVIGAGVVWATPAMQVIQVNKAYAQTTSPGEVGGGGIENPGNGNNGGGGGNGGGNGTPPTDAVPDDVLGDSITPQQPTGNVPTQVGGAGVAAQQRGPTTEVAAETLPVTGIEVFPMAAVGAGLMAAGTAALKLAKQVEPDHPSPGH